MKNMFNIALFISGCCGHLSLFGSVNNLLDKEEIGRYTQCQEDYELAHALQHISLEERYAQVCLDLKQSRELKAQIDTKFIFHHNEISAEKNKNAHANNKQQLVIERESLKFVIRALDGAICSKRAALNYPEMEPQDIEYLNAEIRHLENHRLILTNQCKDLDKEINR